MKIAQALVIPLVLATALCPTAWSRGTSAELRLNGPEEPDTLVDELASTPNFGTIYIADGAGDGTLLNERPAEAVKKIVGLRGAAIPLLIRHLDDGRPTSAKYKGGEHWNDPVSVPVGYLCLDILGQIVSDNRLLFVHGQRDCDYDGMGACFQPKYYFNPDEYSSKGEMFVPSAMVLTVKRNWELARRSGLLKFRFPSWLERFSAAYSIN